MVGTVDGLVGTVDGLVGAVVGAVVGTQDRFLVGTMVGFMVGALVGFLVGALEGALVGAVVGGGLRMVKATLSLPSKAVPLLSYCALNTATATYRKVINDEGY